MKQELKSKVETFIFKSKLTKCITWDDLYDNLDENVVSSSLMEEVLLELNNQDVEVVDFEENFRVAETDDYTYSYLDVYKFPDSLKYFRKYENGDMFCDYLEGKKVSELCSMYNLSKDEIVKRVRTFTRYVTCLDLENRFLSIFLSYEVSKIQAMTIFHLDLITYRFLKLKASTIKKENFNQYNNIDEDLVPLLEKLEKKDLS